MWHRYSNGTGFAGYTKFAESETSKTRVAAGLRVVSLSGGAAVTAIKAREGEWEKMA